MVNRSTLVWNILSWLKLDHQAEDNARLRTQQNIRLRPAGRQEN